MRWSKYNCRFRRSRRELGEVSAVLRGKAGGGPRCSTEDGGEGNEPGGGKASTRGRPERGGERPDTGPGISASRTRPGPSGGARIAPYPVHGAAAPCRRGRAIARVSA